MNLTFGELEEILGMMEACCDGIFHTPPAGMPEGVRSFHEHLSKKYPNRFSALYEGNQVPQEDLLELNPTYEKFRGYWKSKRNQELQPLIKQ